MPNESAYWFQFLRRFSILLSIQATIVTLVSFEIAFYIGKTMGFATPEIGGLWCAISGIVVLQVTINESISAGWLRILGSFFGALSSFLFTTWLGFTLPALACAMFLTVVLTSLFKIKHTTRLACLTAQVIIIVGMVSGNTSPFINSAARLAESAIGTIIAIAVTVLFHPIRKTLGLTQH